MLTLENTQEYSKSTDRYLKVFFPGFRKALAILCQFIGRMSVICGGGSELRHVLGP